MTRPYRFLKTADKPMTVADPPEAVAVESDFVVILAALLCALICVAGLIAVARCAWLRRGSVDTGNRSPLQRAANRGLKKKTIQTFPKFTYDSDKEDKGCGGCGKLSSSDCAICLAEYVDGDEIRVLPHCGHGFHAVCIDTWLNSHSSCPSCRQNLVTTRCKTCGELPSVSTGKTPLEAEDKGGKHGHSSSSSSEDLA
ncbi:unnamed protein product [Lactuca saligna]|uniref:RING-type E3 ubiquitin transferase n=1 Tax=Lactuca saligna TaxID=75948 RepID=A0AA35VXR8_LACSI|nr:unnamed protein product [Lactuca saligna]